MAKLSKKIQILFTPEQYDILLRLARAQKTSVGELVRTAIAKEYGLANREARMAAIERLVGRSDLEVADWEVMEEEGMQRWRER